MNTAPLFDSHCHLDFAAFDGDRRALWQRCTALGITSLLIPGVSPAQWSVAAEMCRQFPGFFYAAGLHPHWIDQPDAPALESIVVKIAAEIERNKTSCVAVGECGLDRLIATPLELQQQWLDVHIALANQLHKPLIIHSVKTHSEVLACFKRQPPRYGGVIHAFSGSIETAQQFIAQGFLLGVGGTITYARAQKTRHTLSHVPLEYLLLETDAPDMPLCGRQGARNSPEYLPDIALCLAQLRGVEVGLVAQATSQNAQRLFGF